VNDKEIDGLIEHGLDLEQELFDILKEEINKEMIKEHGPDWKQKQDEQLIKCIKQVAEDNKNE